MKTQDLKTVRTQHSCKHPETKDKEWVKSTLRLLCSCHSLPGEQLMASLCVLAQMVGELRPAGLWLCTGMAGKPHRKDLVARLFLTI